MTTAQKVALVASAQEACGLAPALAAVDLAHSTWYYHRDHVVPYEEKYAHLRPILGAIVRQHPEYGYRRITVELRAVYGYLVNHKVVQRLLRCWGLAWWRPTQPPRPSGIRQMISAAGKQVNLVVRLEPIELFQVAYTDFTELRFADGRQKAYLMPIIGHVCKMAYGWAVGERANTGLALRAWERAKATFQRYAIPYTGMIMHHDQDRSSPAMVGPANCS